jgi:DNA-directed RNA polymerase subunit RPC12/RpoP
MAVQLECPSCGASVKVRKGVPSVECQYCGSSVIVPGYKEKTSYSSPKPFIFPAKSCGGTIAVITVVSALLVAGLAVFVYHMTGSAVKEVSAATSDMNSSEEQVPLVNEFGRVGNGSGCFQDPVCIATDNNNHVYVGERETGRIQVFERNGKYIRQWSFSQSGEYHLSSMSAGSDGTVYLVYGGELFAYSGETGELLDSLQHPEGWGFDDVDTAPDGSILASWRKNEDDIIRFDSNGEITLLLKSAISSNTGDTELSTTMAAGNLGEFYAFGSFNGVVLSFNPNGRFIDRFGSDDMFIMPSGMDVDPEGRLWISDFGNLLVFSSSGELLKTVDSGVSLGDFVINTDRQLFGITVDGTVVQLDLSNY